jgi:hypothetical protein
VPLLSALPVDEMVHFASRLGSRHGLVIARIDTLSGGS